MKIIAIHTHFIQYNTCIFQRLSEKFDLNVLLLSKLNTPVDFSNDISISVDQGFGKSVNWTNPYEFDKYIYITNKYSINFNIFLIALSSLKIVSYVCSYKPKYIILFNHGVLQFCVSAIFRLLHIPYLIRTEVVPQRYLPSSPLVFLRSLFLCLYYKHAAKVYTINSSAQRYLFSIGVPLSKVNICNYSHDTFQHRVDHEVASESKTAIRKFYNIKEDEYVLLYSGRLASEKNIFCVHEALSLIPELERSNLRFISMGAGPLEEEWERRMKSLMGDKFINISFIKQDKIFEIYSIANALVLPSSFNETWGLVLNEAIASDCIIFASSACGASTELRSLGNDVRIFTASSPLQLSDLIRFWIFCPTFSLKAEIREFPSSNTFIDQLTNDLDSLGSNV